MAQAGVVLVSARVIFWAGCQGIVGCNFWIKVPGLTHSLLPKFRINLIAFDYFILNDTLFPFPFLYDSMLN